MIVIVRIIIRVRITVIVRITVVVRITVRVRLRTGARLRTSTRLRDNMKTHLRATYAALPIQCRDSAIASIASIQVGLQTHLYWDHCSDPECSWTTLTPTRTLTPLPGPH